MATESFSGSLYSIEIVVPKQPQKGFFGSFFDIVFKNKPATEKKIKKILEDYARTGHREQAGRHYKKQTGRLSKSTRAEGTLATKIRLYVDETQADYARYVIEPRKGQNTWKGDPFIDETIKAKMPEIEKLLNDLYNGCVVEWNRQTFSIF